MSNIACAFLNVPEDTCFEAAIWKATVHIPGKEPREEFLCGKHCNQTSAEVRKLGGHVDGVGLGKPNPLYAHAKWLFAFHLDDKDIEQDDLTELPHLEEIRQALLLEAPKDDREVLQAENWVERVRDEWA